VKNKKVLLVGTSFSAVPLLLSLKEQGYYIAVCGGLKEDPCHSFADQSYYIDYSKKELLLKLCEENDFDFLIPSCNDFSYNSCSYVSTKLNKFYGFDNYEKTMLLHTKNAFRKFTLQNNLSVPRAIKYNENLDFDNLELNYPILVKPDYSFSGKGISKVYDISELKASINHAKDNSKNGELILEEFVKGELFSHSAFIQNGEISIDFFVSEFCTVYPYQVDYSYLSNDLDEEVRLKVRKEISYIVKELNLVDGLLHTQFISDKKNFWLI
jgi:formate-dependent phosphoribosylglycinamide formyltransferase (GAR transformylase)